VTEFAAWVRIAITPAAFEEIAATLALGTVAVEPERPKMAVCISGSILASCACRPVQRAA
jgi:hypothetical protein